MDPLIEKFAVLLVLAFAVLFLNMKLGNGLFKFLSFWVMIFAFAGAGWFALQVVLR